MAYQKTLHHSAKRPPYGAYPSSPTSTDNPVKLLMLSSRGLRLSATTRPTRPTSGWMFPDMQPSSSERAVSHRNRCCRPFNHYKAECQPRMLSSIRFVVTYAGWDMCWKPSRTTSHPASVEAAARIPRYWAWTAHMIHLALGKIGTRRGSRSHLRGPIRGPTLGPKRVDSHTLSNTLVSQALTVTRAVTMERMILSTPTRPTARTTNAPTRSIGSTHKPRDCGDDSHRSLPVKYVGLSVRKVVKAKVRVKITRLSSPVLLVSREKGKVS